MKSRHKIRTALAILALVVGLVIALPACSINYRQQMRDFVQTLSTYAKEHNPNFIIIPQNGVELVSTTGDKEGLPVRGYLKAIDGIGQESLFYGYYEDGIATPKNETHRLSSLLEMAKREKGVTILVTDYCQTKACIDNSMRRSREKGYLAFAADHRELSKIPRHPASPHNKNHRSIRKLSEASNFLYLINPDSFSTRQELVKALSETDYDLIIMDFFFKGDEYTKAQIEQLKTKNNGSRRLVLSYLSIGEAEDYRYYWSAQWRERPPSWLKGENPDWPGNYRVEYWSPKWQHLIFGDHSSYLDKILRAGFDGAYLDIIDAFEYFENPKNAFD